MFRDRRDVWNRLSEIWASTNIPELELTGARFALLSDIHLGNGSDSDDFANNELALRQALEYYRKRDFTLILLGDVEEFWQFDLAAIKLRYEKNIYSKFRSFPPGKIIRIFGNHDYEWGGFVDPISESSTSHSAPEGLKLKDASGAARILLVHGHQGTIESDKFSWFSRFFVRLFRFIEPLAKTTQLYSNPTATKSQIAKDYERTLYQWAKANKVILVCGHSHRAIFASKSYAQRVSEKISRLELENYDATIDPIKHWENLRAISHLSDELADEKAKGRWIEATDPDNEPLPCYFNTGCAVFSDGLTALEISEDKIRLVKWSHDSPQAAAYQVYNEEKLSDILNKLI